MSRDGAPLAVRLRIHKRVCACVCACACACVCVTSGLSNSFHQHRLSNTELQPQVGGPQLVQTQVHTAQQVIWGNNTHTHLITQTYIDSTHKITLFNWGETGERIDLKLTRQMQGCKDLKSKVTTYLKYLRHTNSKDALALIPSQEKAQCSRKSRFYFHTLFRNVAIYRF